MRAHKLKVTIGHMRAFEVNFFVCFTRQIQKLRQRESWRLSEAQALRSRQVEGTQAIHLEVSSPTS